MNKKSKYQRIRGQSDKLDSLDLLNLMYAKPCGIYNTMEKLLECWKKHRDEILKAWDETYPDSKPIPFWVFDAPDEPRKLPPQWSFSKFCTAYYSRER